MTIKPYGAPQLRCVIMHNFTRMHICQMYATLSQQVKATTTNIDLEGCNGQDDAQIGGQTLMKDLERGEL